MLPDQDMRGGQIYKPLRKIWDSTLTISGHNASLFSLKAIIGQAGVYIPWMATQPKREQGAPNLILFQPPRFSCWFEMVLITEITITWLRVLLTEISCHGPHGAGEGLCKLCKMLITLALDPSGWKSGHDVGSLKGRRRHWPVVVEGGRTLSQRLGREHLGTWRC